MKSQNKILVVKALGYLIDSCSKYIMATGGLEVARVSTYNKLN